MVVPIVSAAGCFMIFSTLFCLRPSSVVAPGGFGLNQFVLQSYQRNWAVDVSQFFFNCLRIQLGSVPRQL